MKFLDAFETAYELARTFQRRYSVRKESNGWFFYQLPLVDWEALKRSRND